MLKHLREEKKLTQKQVAEYLGIQYTTYQRYENKKQELPIRHAIKLRELYGRSLDFIYGVGM